MQWLEILLSAVLHLTGAYGMYEMYQAIGTPDANWKFAAFAFMASALSGIALRFISKREEPSAPPTPVME